MFPVFMLYMNEVYLDTDVEVIIYFTSLLKGKFAIFDVEDVYKI